MRKLVLEHAETRWLALRLDTDIQEIRSDLREIRDVQLDHSARLVSIERELDEHSTRFDSIDRQLEGHALKLQEHTGRFDSVDAQLRSLTQLVGRVLRPFDERD